MLVYYWTMFWDTIKNTFKSYLHYYNEVAVAVV